MAKRIVTLNVEESLLEQIDELAKLLNLSRSALVCLLLSLIVKASADDESGLDGVAKSLADEVIERLSNPE